MKKREKIRAIIRKTQTICGIWYKINLPREMVDFGYKKCNKEVYINVIIYSMLNIQVLR